MKGADSKNIIFKKLTEVFPGSFMDDKVLRIPLSENGEPLEIKVSLTCAKDILGSGVAVSAFSDGAAAPAAPQLEISEADIEPTEDEKENVAKMLKSLNLNF